MKRIVPILVAVAVTAAVAAQALAGTVTVRSGSLTGTLQAGTHNPKINRNWWITVKASLKGRPATAGAWYQFLYNGTQVSKQAVRHNWNFRFHGSFRDNLVFPSRAVGQPLTVRVVVSAGGQTVYLPYAVKPVR